MNNHRVFIVDDDQDLCELFELSLVSAGYEAAYCRLPEHALERCKTFTPDLILMDLSLPGTQGDELFKQLREQGIDTPVAFLTAETSEAKKTSLMDIGAVDVLVKPLKPAELVTAVEQILAS